MKNPDLSISPAAIWRLTWPQMLQMYLVFVISFTPVWTAGKLSEDVQAALGMASQAQLFLNVVCMGLASGATAAISQSLGALRRRRAEYYVTATCLGSLFAGLIIGAAGYAFTDLVLALTNIPVGIRPVAGEIWKIFMLALPFQYVYSATGVIFRATRMVIPPLLVAAFVALVHAFICIGTGLGLFGLPDWGYRGIAWAGFAAEFVGAAVNCVLLLRAGHLHAASLPPVRWLRKGLPYLVRVAIPAGISSLVWQSGYLVLFILVGTVPVERVAALAGLTAGLRIEALVFMPGMAFNMSAAVLVGNCLGAGDRKGAKKVSLTLLWAATLLLTLVAAAMWPFRDTLASFLSNAPDARRYIVSYLSWNLACGPFSIISTVLGGVMVGAGATRYNLYIFGSSFWGLRIPLGYVLGHMVWQNASGVFCAMFISQVLQSCVMLFVFFRLDWQRFAMRALPPEGKTPSARQG